MSSFDPAGILEALFPAAWLSNYQDSLYYDLVVITPLLSIAAFLTFALPWTLLAFLDPQPLQRFKIQQKPFQVRKFFLPNIARITINTTILIALMSLLWPFFRHINTIHLGELPAWYIIAGQLIFFVILDDFLYYWMHRGMHQRWILKHIHGVHHRIKNTCALDGNYFHWVEFVATGLLALLPPLLVGAHLYVLYLWIIIRQFEAADGHSGYDIPYNPVKLIPCYHGAIYHDFHHAKFKGNFSGFLSYLDGWMGNTYIPSYLSYLNNRKKGLAPKEANENNHTRNK